MPLPGQNGTVADVSVNATDSIDSRAGRCPVLVFRNPVTHTAARPAPEATLVRSIGTLALAAPIVNITVGAGIFRVPADVA